MLMKPSRHARRFARVAVAALVLALASACVVRERARPVAPCAGAVWVEGHYNRAGVWRPGHWRCPGVVIIED